MGSRDSNSVVGIAQQLNGNSSQSLRLHALQVSRPRGVLQCIVFCVLFLAAGTSALRAQSNEPNEERPFFVIGVGAGAISVDIPNPEKPGETFGTKFRSRFDLGFRPQHWLELAAELGLTQLGAADSVNAILEGNGFPPDAAYTMVDWNVGARIFMPGTTRFVPWFRGGIGQAWLRLAAPNGYRQQDLAWVLGVGIDYEPWRSVLFRSEARYLGQQSADSTPSSLSVDLGIFYALRRSQFD